MFLGDALNPNVFPLYAIKIVGSCKGSLMEVSRFGSESTLINKAQDALQCLILSDISRELQIKVRSSKSPTNAVEKQPVEGENE